MNGGAGQSGYDIASYTKKNLVAVFWALQKANDQHMHLKYHPITSYIFLSVFKIA